MLINEGHIGFKKDIRLINIEEKITLSVPVTTQ